MLGESTRDNLLAFVFVQTQHREGHTAAELARISEVEELHRLAGEDCYVVRVRVASTEALGRLVRERIESIDAVCGTRITIVLKTVKDRSLEPSARAARAARPRT
ncbi:MAG: Lrp/AsnC ligand binding domain-containing protein [Blastocatellia bacterium]